MEDGARSRMLFSCAFQAFSGPLWLPQDLVERFPRLCAFQGRVLCRMLFSCMFHVLSDVLRIPYDAVRRSSRPCGLQGGVPPRTLLPCTFHAVSGAFLASHHTMQRLLQPCEFRERRRCRMLRGIECCFPTRFKRFSGSTDFAGSREALSVCL